MDDTTRGVRAAERAFDAPAERVWIALRDPLTVRDALPPGVDLAPADGRDRPPGSLARLLAADEERREARTVDVGERYEVTVDASAASGVPAAIVGDVTVEADTFPRLELAGAFEVAGRGVEATAEAVVEEAGSGCHVTLDVRVSVPAGRGEGGPRRVESAIDAGADAYLDRLAGELRAVDGPTSERAVKDPDWR